MPRRILLPLLFLRRRKAYFVVLIVLIFGGANLVSADTVVVPNSLAGTEGNESNCWPFTPCFGTGHYQQVYGSSQFGGSINIGSILFRPNYLYGGVFTVTSPSVDISLSTTSKAVDGLDSIFANNLGADNTLVRSGALTLSSAFTGPAGGPKDFDILISLTTPFLYNPASGNLLLDVVVNSSFVFSFLSGGNEGDVFFDAEWTLGDSVSRISLFENIDTLGLVTRFDYTPVNPVPEPATLSLLAVGLGSLVVRRRRSRPRS